MIGHAITVHRTLGPGLLESVYARCFAHELKTVERLLPLHQTQVLTYLRLSGMKQALLINFNVPRLVDGLRSFLAWFAWLVAGIWSIFDPSGPSRS